MDGFTVGELIVTLIVLYALRTALISNPDNEWDRTTGMKIRRWAYRNRMGDFLLRCVVNIPLIILVLWLVQKTMATLL